MRPLYLDHNATTPLLPEVAELLALRAREAVHTASNASSVHAAGRAARARLQKAREEVADLLGCEPGEVFFTGSGSEGNAMALLGAFRARPQKDRVGVVVSAIEHPALLAVTAVLESEGARVTRVAPRQSGRVDEADLLAAFDEQTLLCALMAANNETGVIQPADAAARACRTRGVLFHCDAIQAAGKVPLALHSIDASTMTLAAHKFGGPPGVGVLVSRRGVPLAPLIPGHQERGYRGGTPSVVACEALALALRQSVRGLEERGARLADLRDLFERRVLERIAGTQRNGEDPRVPNTSNLRFDRVDAEALMISLDLESIAVSTGAACATGSLTPSHVLVAAGLSAGEARASLRFSFGGDFTSDDVAQVVDALERLVPACQQ